MSANKFTDEFKRDAVAQVEDRGYPVREVSERLGVSTKSSYTWQKQFSRPARVIHEVDAQADEIRWLKRDLLRVTEERDILKKKKRWWFQPISATDWLKVSAGVRKPSVFRGLVLSRRAT